MADIMIKLAWATIGLLCLWFLFMAIDTIGLAKHTTTGHIVYKEYKPPYVTYNTTVTTSGQSIITPTSYPESFNITVTAIGEKDIIKVYETLYNSLDKGQSVDVEYIKGRFSGSIYLTGIVDNVRD